jgi:hypothetical protein
MRIEVVKLSNRYVQFYEAIIVGLLAFFVELVHYHLNTQLDLLLKYTSDENKGM